MKKISIVSGCYNERDNVAELVSRISSVMTALPKYEYEIILIDNCSTDGTQTILRNIASKNARVKVIFNVRNFGYIRSSAHGLKSASGDAVVYMTSDLQDPPELIAQFLEKWEDGYKVVAAVKEKSEGSRILVECRKAYYTLTALMSDAPIVKNWTGFGLYDRCVVDELRRANDPYPYFRGFIAELGYEIAFIPFIKPVRKRGVTKFNFYNLYDIGMLGITAHTKIPLRMATFLGLGTGLVSLFIGFVYLVFKVLYWDEFQGGLAPLIIGFFFFGAIQLVFIGIIGEYVGAIYTKCDSRPLVVERGRLNFERPSQSLCEEEMR